MAIAYIEYDEGFNPVLRMQKVLTGGDKCLEYENGKGTKINRLIESG